MSSFDDFPPPPPPRYIRILPKKNHQMNKAAIGQQSLTSHWAHRFMTEEWNGHNSSRALELLQSGEGADCIIEVQEQPHSDDGPSRRCSSSSKMGKAGKGTLRRAIEDIQQQQQEGVQKKKFHVHKYVLIANSEVFSAMFSHKNTAEFREGRITIKDSTAVIVRHMIHYMYTGKISDDFYLETDALPLLAIAHKYQIKPLVNFNEQILSQSVALDNVFERLKFAELYQTEALKSACAHMIWQNLRELKRKPEWIELKKSSPALAFYVVEEFV